MYKYLAASSPPLNPSVRAMDTTTVTVTLQWEPPRMPNGIISAFLVKHNCFLQCYFIVLCTPSDIILWFQKL